MAKKIKIPKRVAGIKLPKTLRRSKMLQHLLHSAVGRKILADALVAGASAGAATLVAERGHVADATEGAARRGKRTVGLVGEAIENAADAVFAVVSDAARALLPDDKKKRRDRDDYHPSDEPSGSRH